MKLVQALDTSSRMAGGMFESVKGLSRGLLGHGQEVVVVAGSDQWSPTDRASWQPVPLRECPSDGIANGLLGRGMIDALMAEGPDFLHVHGLWGVAARAGVTWARRTGRPYAISPRGMLDAWAWRRSRRKKQLSAILWEDRLISGASFVHALNQSEAASLHEFGIKSPIVIVPNGVDLPGLPTPAQESPRPNDRKILLFLGRLHPKKGLQELLQGWARLAPAVRREWRLVIAGWDEVGHLDRLMALAATLGILDDITFPGAAYGREKDELLRISDAFILPSLSEGLPVAVLEAWSYGLPVFMTKACNLSDAFQAQAAFEVGTEPASMAQVLGDWLQNGTALREVGERGRARAAASYGWNAVSRQMRDAYLEAMAGAHGR